MMMVVVMMVMVMRVYHDHLRLRCMRYSKAPEQDQSKPKLFHALLWGLNRSPSVLF